MRIRIDSGLLGKANCCAEVAKVSLIAWIGRAWRNYPECNERVAGGGRTGSCVVECPDSLFEEIPDVIRGRMTAAVLVEYEKAWLAGLEESIAQIAGFRGLPVEEVRADILKRIESGRSLTA